MAGEEDGMFDKHLKAWPKYAPRQLRLPQTSVYTNLEVSALRYADKSAIIYYDTAISYRELQQEAEALAGYLQRLGVAKGDRVLLYMQNSPQFVIGFYAILRADAVVVLVNPMNRTAELQHYVEDTDAAVALCGQELFPFLQPLLGNSPLTNVIVTAYGEYVRQPTDLRLPEVVAQPVQNFSGEGVHMWADAIAAGIAPGPHTAGPDDLSVFPYSSGTTGAPKGCMHTHYSLMATIVQGVRW